MVKESGLGSRRVSGSNPPVAKLALRCVHTLLPPADFSDGSNAEVAFCFLQCRNDKKLLTYRTKCFMFYLKTSSPGLPEKGISAKEIYLWD